MEIKEAQIQVGYFYATYSFADKNWNVSGDIGTSFEFLDFHPIPNCSSEDAIRMLENLNLAVEAQISDEEN